MGLKAPASTRSASWKSKIFSLSAHRLRRAARARSARPAKVGEALDARSRQGQIIRIASLSHQLSQPRETKEFFEPLIQVDQLKSALRGFRRNIQTKNCAQSGTIQIVHIRQVQPNPL